MEILMTNKVKVKTSGDFMIHDIFGGHQTVIPGEEVSVERTPFVETCLRDGRLIAVEGKAKVAEKEPEPGKGPTSGTAAKK